MATDDDVTLGELGRRMNAQNDTIERSFGQLRNDFASLRAESILRAEYEVRMTNTDRELREMKTTHLREIRDIETKMNAKTLPWPTVGSFVVAAAALIVAILPKLVA